MFPSNLSCFPFPHCPTFLLILYRFVLVIFILFMFYSYFCAFFHLILLLPFYPFYRVFYTYSAFNFSISLVVHNQPLISDSLCPTYQYQNLNTLFQPSTSALPSIPKSPTPILPPTFPFFRLSIVNGFYLFRSCPPPSMSVPIYYSCRPLHSPTCLPTPALSPICLLCSFIGLHVSLVCLPAPITYLPS